MRRISKTQVTDAHWITRLAVDDDFVMKNDRFRVSRPSRLSDDLSAPYFMTDMHVRRKGRQMAVSRLNAVTMTDQDHIAVSAGDARLFDDAVTRCIDAMRVTC